jgi:release factor glutamine methyltransferase
MSFNCNNSSTNSDTLKIKVLNRSFSRRIGKHLSQLQMGLLEDKLPQCKVDKENPTNKAQYAQEIFLEIGFGMGEHIANQASLNREVHYIGCEPYMNGVANLLKIATQDKLNNISIWPDDVDIILNNIPSNSLRGVYILFPDPWPKARHLKRRIVNPIRLKIIQEKLQANGVIYFASDIYDYVDQVKELMKEFGFKQINIDEFTPHAGYIQTKYHSKASKNIIKPRFLQFTKG